MRHFKSIAPAILIAITLWGCGSPDLARPTAPHPTQVNDVAPTDSEPPLEITIIDVGQGDSILVRSPDHKTLLIDAGPPEAGTNYVLPTLRKKGISRIDQAIATHHHLDHYGGFSEIAAGEDKILGTRDDVPFPLLEREEVQIGEDPLKSGTIQVTVIAANGVFSDGLAIPLQPGEENEASVALLIRFGDFEFLTAGDLTGGGPSGKIVTKNLEHHLGELVGHVDLLKVGHHGSNTSSRDDFLDLITPQVAVISRGVHNDYGHPHPEVIDRLQRHAIDIFQTVSGNIEISTHDGKTFTVNGKEYRSRQ